MDHKDPTKITWLEFVQWYEDEGIFRDKMHEIIFEESGVSRLSVIDAKNY